jgi:hypothetical protein
MSIDLFGCRIAFRSPTSDTIDKDIMDFCVLWDFTLTIYADSIRTARFPKPLFEYLSFHIGMQASIS